MIKLDASRAILTWARIAQYELREKGTRGGCRAIQLSGNPARGKRCGCSQHRDRERGGSMLAQCRPLRDVLAEIPDFRQARGRRHPLSAILSLACVAVLCGYRSYSAVAQWARIYPEELVRALGFTHPTPPCAAC